MPSLLPEKDYLVTMEVRYKVSATSGGSAKVLAFLHQVRMSENSSDFDDQRVESLGMDCVSCVEEK